MFKGFSTYGRTRPPFTLTDIELIKQDLLNQFMTVRGSRVMRPEYGSIIHELVYEPLDEVTIEDIRDDVVRIVRSDPRVSLTDINVTESDMGVSVIVDLLFMPGSVPDQLIATYQRNNDEVI